MDTERIKDNHKDQGLVGDLEEARRMYEEGLNEDLLAVLGEEFWDKMDKAQETD